MVPNRILPGQVLPALYRLLLSHKYNLLLTRAYRDLNEPLSTP